MDKRKEFGNIAEAIAADYLSGKGYDIIDKNFRKPWGEIDIITKKKGMFIFVEVKANSRAGDSAFDPQVRANYEKMKKIIKTATLYLGRIPGGLDNEWRIDVISVTIDQDRAHITHYKNVGEALY